MTQRFFGCQAAVGNARRRRRPAGGGFWDGPCRFNPRRLRRRTRRRRPGRRARPGLPLDPPQPDQEGRRIALDRELLGQHVVVGRLGRDRRHHAMRPAQALPPGAKHLRVAAADCPWPVSRARVLSSDRPGLAEALAARSPGSFPASSLPASVHDAKTAEFALSSGHKHYRLEASFRFVQSPRGSSRAMPGEQKATDHGRRTRSHDRSRDAPAAPYNVVILNDEEHTFPVRDRALDQALPAPSPQGRRADPAHPSRPVGRSSTPPTKSSPSSSATRSSPTVPTPEWRSPKARSVATSSRRQIGLRQSITCPAQGRRTCWAVRQGW